MKFIIGLGNPGLEYQNNRHNVGFMLVEKLAQSINSGVSWQNNNKLKAEIAKVGQTILVKPQDYMNNSGQVARQVIGFYEKSADLSQVIVIHDDLDIKFGEFKIQQGKGPKAHNGLLDLDSHLGGSDYWHVRVGVDNRDGVKSGMSGADYVLTNFTSEEQDKLSLISQDLINQLKDLIDK